VLSVYEVSVVSRVCGDQSTVAGISVGGVVVACAAGRGREVETAAVGAGPAWVAGAEGGGAEAVQGAVFVCCACLCG